MFYVVVAECQVACEKITAKWKRPMKKYRKITKEVSQSLMRFFFFFFFPLTE